MMIDKRLQKTLYRIRESVVLASLQKNKINFGNKKEKMQINENISDFSLRLTNKANLILQYNQSEKNNSKVISEIKSKKFWQLVLFQVIIFSSLILIIKFGFALKG